MYCRREPAGQFIYGGMGYRTPAGGVGGWSWLYKDAARIFPSLKGVKWSYRWGGTIAVTPDRVPHMYEPQPGLICGLGYNGRGVAMSLVMGREMARRALGAATENLPFPLAPIKPYPFREPQVLGAGVAMSYWRMLDQREMGLKDQSDG
jgi:sarcosine oxidase